jgi:hypothetical protein
MPTRFERVVFIDDFLRNADNGVQPHPLNRRFLCALFGVALRRLGMPFREEGCVCDGGTIDTRAFMRLLGIERGVAGWAAACNQEYPDAADALLQELLKPRTLVIGWGLPPALLRYLDRRSVAFLDLEVDPMRFLNQLNFCARTNDAQIDEALSTRIVPTEEIWGGATQAQAMLARKVSGSLIDRGMRFGLFVAQTTQDLSLIADGRLRQAGEFQERLAFLAETVDGMLIKPHPHDSGPAHDRALQKLFPKSLVIARNYYSLLVADNLAFVCGLSSGGLKEAQFFFKPSHALIHPDRDNPRHLPQACTPWRRASVDIAAIVTLERMLSDSSVPGTTYGTTGAAALPRDTIAAALGTRWGFDDIASVQDAPQMAAIPQAQTASLQNLPAQASLIYGWSQPEAWGTWTEGEKASIALRLVQPLENGVRLLVRVSGHAFKGSPARHPEISLRIANVDAALRRPAKQESISFEACVHSEQLMAGQLIPIEINIRNPVSPFEVGQSEDHRQLGFGIARIDVATVVETDGMPLLEKIGLQGARWWNRMWAPLGEQQAPGVTAFAQSAAVPRLKKDTA